MPPPVLPAVTVGSVISTVSGEHTVAGLVIIKLGLLIVTITGLISKQVPTVLLM